MKKTSFIILAAAMILLNQTAPLISQSLQPDKIANKPADNSPVYLAAIKAMQASNQQLIEKQEKTLIQLDNLQKESDQIRILARRS